MKTYTLHTVNCPTAALQYELNRINEDEMMSLEHVIDNNLELGRVTLIIACHTDNKSH